MIEATINLRIKEDFNRLAVWADDNYPPEVVAQMRMMVVEYAFGDWRFVGKFVTEEDATLFRLKWS
jgi:hypothetical protein